VLSSPCVTLHHPGNAPALLKCLEAGEALHQVGTYPVLHRSILPGAAGVSFKHVRRVLPSGASNCVMHTQDGALSLLRPQYHHCSQLIAFFSDRPRWVGLVFFQG
jgi:hypothetical protein